ncbi:MAG TPA: hypothetical protein VJP89_22530 [Pyrinomonadaceae bacterium]|nr:hypothetical protein [Pyrinomonadaceae bacterium]
MATKKQNFEQPNENASAASKTPERKQSGNEPFTAPGQTTPANQGKSFNQVATGTPGKGASNQGSTGQTGQAATGQGASQRPSGQGTTSQGTTGQTGQGAGQGANQRSSSQSTGADQDLLQHAKQATGEIVNQVQQQAGSQLARQKDSAATDLTQVVQAVRRFGESLTGQGQEGGPIARYAAEYGDKAANSLERFSTYIREQDPKQLLNDVQNFGRRRPALLLGGAFLLGLAGARLIKSSMSMQSQHSFQPNTPAMRPPTSPNAH